MARNTSKQAEVVIDADTTVQVDGETINVQSVVDMKDSFLATCVETAGEYPGWCTTVSWLWAVVMAAMIIYIVDMLLYMLAIGVVLVTGSMVAGSVVYYGLAIGAIGYLAYDLFSGGPITQKLDKISTAAGITTVGGIVHLKRKLFGKKDTALIVQEA